MEWDWTASSPSAPLLGLGDTVASCWLLCVFVHHASLIVLCLWLCLSPVPAAIVCFLPASLLMFLIVGVCNSVYLYPVPLRATLPRCSISFGLSLPRPFTLLCILLSHSFQFLDSACPFGYLPEILWDSRFWPLPAQELYPSDGDLVFLSLFLNLIKPFFPRYVSALFSTVTCSTCSRTVHISRNTARFSWLRASTGAPIMARVEVIASLDSRTCFSTLNVEVHLVAHSCLGFSSSRAICQWEDFSFSGYCGLLKEFQNRLHHL